MRPQPSNNSGPALPRRLPWPCFLVAFSVAYFLAAKLGIATAMSPEGIVILWPPNAIVLAALLVVQRRQWWQLFLVTVATEIAADVPAYPLWAAAGYGIVNFSEAALAAFLLQWANGKSAPLASLRDFVRFLAIGPLLASGTAALLGAAIYKFGNPDLDYLHYWRVFWLGDALGLLTVGTALLAWNRPPDATPELRPLRTAEAVILSLGLLAVSSWALLRDAHTPGIYLIFPFLMWAALRFGVRGASLATIATATIAIGSAVTGRGPFVELSQIAAVMSLQGLVAAVAISTFALAFATEASIRLSAQLKRANRALDKQVEERTNHLRQALDHNELLLREIYHRVKNDLQLLSSILSLHGRNEPAPELRQKFVAVQTQIGAIAATYDVLQQVESVELVRVDSLIPSLCQGIQNAHGGLVTLSWDIEGEMRVSPDAAVALALALNELIINSIKHANPGEPVSIDVAARSDDGEVHVRVTDDGAGFPPDFQFEDAVGFGFRMTRSVVEQAGGHIMVHHSRPGADVELVLPAASDPAADAPSHGAQLATVERPDPGTAAAGSRGH